jgi:hypothetical protein
MSCQLWRNDAADDVGRKLEFQSEEQPHAETPPELLACTVRGPGCGNDPEQFGECLECSVRDDETAAISTSRAAVRATCSNNCSTPYPRELTRPSHVPGGPCPGIFRNPQRSREPGAAYTYTHARSWPTADGGDNFLA